MSSANDEHRDIEPGYRSRFRSRTWRRAVARVTTCSYLLSSIQAGYRCCTPGSMRLGSQTWWLTADEQLARAYELDLLRSGDLEELLGELPVIDASPARAR